MRPLFLSLAFVAQTPFAQLIYFEDFSGMGVVPTSVTNTTTGGAMSAYNVDGNTPNAAVSYVTDAWIGREDFIYDPTDTVAFSTSWYAPVGQADDWMVTPQLILPSDLAILSWEAVAPDQAYPDGYTVYVSANTNSVVDLLAGTPVFTTAGEAGVWTRHAADLSAFASQSIYIGFRNNSNNQFLLMIDDIRVFAGHDLSITAVNQEYTAVTLDAVRGCPADLGATVLNQGVDTATNVFVQCNIYKDTVLMTTFYSDTVTSLPDGVDTTMTLADTFPIRGIDFYIYEYIVKLDQVDVINSNDTMFGFQNVNSTIMARDDNVLNGSLGIGAGVTGVLGQNFTLKNASTLVSVTGFLNNPTFGQPTRFEIYNTDVVGLPDTVPFASTSDHIITTADSAAFLTLEFDTSIELAAGTYFLGMVEVDSNLTLGYSNDIFTPGATWVRWPTAAILPWGNSEAYGFSIAYILRPIFEPCPRSVMLSGVIPGSKFDIKHEVDSMILSTDLIESGATNILYDAGFSIDLLQGFSVELGAEFEAVIDGCGGLRHAIKNRKVMNVRGQEVRSKNRTPAFKEAFVD